MRLLHTSDWHLGHTLCDLPRDYEHEQFLAWLLDTLVAEQVDALLIAGDIFDTANPPASAQAAWYEFLAQVHARRPALQIVAIGGNHDSASRLDAPATILQALSVHMVGGLPHRADGTLDLERLLVPLTDASGRPAALVAAMPFLRPSDLPAVPETEGDPLIEGVRRIHAEVFEAANVQRAPDQALVAMGHLYMAHTEISELSERKILGGNLHALPADIFGPEVAYAALGHLHRAQKVGDRPHVRYSGSPLPLSMTELSYRHAVTLVDLEGATVRDIRSLTIPRTTEVLRLPPSGPGPLADVLGALALLPPRRTDTPEGARPFLEVQLLAEQPDPQLRNRVEAAMAGKEARLVKISLQYTGSGSALADSLPSRSLDDLTEEAVFRALYSRSYEGDPTPELLAAFAELLDEIGRDDTDDPGEARPPGDPLTHAVALEASVGEQADGALA